MRRAASGGDIGGQRKGARLPRFGLLVYPGSAASGRGRCYGGVLRARVGAWGGARGEGVRITCWGAQGSPRNHQRAAGGGHVLKRPENSAPFPASHLPHPFPSKPRERRRTRSYKKPSQERSEVGGGGRGRGRREGRMEQVDPQDSARPSCGGVGGTGGGAGLRTDLGFASFRAHLVTGATSRDAPVL